MNRYRIAFFVTLTTTILLAGVLTVQWLKPGWIDARISWITSLQHTRAHEPHTEAPEPPAPSTVEASLAPVTLTPQRMQSIGVKTGLVEYRQIHDQIRTTGNVEVDETHLAEVQVRFAGWIQSVYVDSTFKQVRKGQPLLTIYSPELVSTENEYLLAKQNRGLLARSTVPGVAAGADTLLASVCIMGPYCSAILARDVGRATDCRTA